MFARYLNVTAGSREPVGARREAATRRFAEASDVGREERSRVGCLIGEWPFIPPEASSMAEQYNSEGPCGDP